ncbi:hypothetical protein [Sphingomonas bacterium]|uniref:hypothetical protein n=1 Tax=Sphingomonas bacterium TaxID=1895847 RepID=UPI001576A4E7|nr:hypothetical protein [Sphingomonas bacterium]
MKPVFAFLALLSAASAMPALARPATPNREQAQVIGPHAIRISWRDATTSSEGSFHSGGPNLNFEVQAQAPDRSSGYLHFDVFDGNTDRVHWDATNLGPGHHCFVIWSRDPDNDMRSELPTAAACADIPLDRATYAGPPLGFGTIRPMRGQIVWLAPDGAGIRAMETDGFVLAITPGRLCPAQWRNVVHQNGGFSGLGGAGARKAADPYWLCWSALLPPGTSVTPPTSSQPPLRR